MEIEKQITQLIKANPNTSYEDAKRQALQAGIGEDIFEKAWIKANRKWWDFIRKYWLRMTAVILLIVLSGFGLWLAKELEINVVSIGKDILKQVDFSIAEDERFTVSLSEDIGYDTTQQYFSINGFINFSRGSIVYKYKSSVNPTIDILGYRRRDSSLDCMSAHCFSPQSITKELSLTKTPIVLSIMINGQRDQYEIGMNDKNLYLKPIKTSYTEPASEVFKRSYSLLKTCPDFEDIENVQTQLSCLSKYPEYAKLFNPSYAYSTKSSEYARILSFLSDESKMLVKKILDVGESGFDAETINGLSEEIQIYGVENDNSFTCDILQGISSPTLEMQLAAVKSMPSCIQYIQEPKAEVQLMAYEKGSVYDMQYVENPTEEIQILIVNSGVGGQSNEKLKYLNVMGEKAQISAMEQSVWNFHYIKNPNKKTTETYEDWQIEEATRNPVSFGKLNNPSEKVQIAAVSKNWRSLEYIDNPSESVITAAVFREDKRCNGLEYVKNPSESLQIEAVKWNPNCLMYIKNPSNKVRTIREEQIEINIQAQVDAALSSVKD